MTNRLSPVAAGVVLLLLMGMGSLCGCRSEPKQEAFVAPLLVTTSGHFVGTPLSGPTSNALPRFTSDTAWSLRVSFIALEKAPGIGQALGAESRLVASPEGGTPVVPTGRLTRNARIVGVSSDAGTLEESQFGRNLPVSSFDSVLPAGVTAVFTVAESTPLTDQATEKEARRLMQVAVYRPARGGAGNQSAYQLALIIEDRASNGSGGTAGGATIQQELAILDRSWNAGEATVLVVPMSFGSAGAIAAMIQIRSGSADAQHEALVSKCRAELARSSKAAAARRQIAVEGISAASGFDVAITALNAPESRRAALAFLSRQSGAAICEDAALVAPDDCLAKLSAEVGNAVSELGAPLTNEKLGWALEKTCISILSAMKGDGTLAPELSAVLASHAGEAGRRPASLEEVLRGTPTLEGLESRITAENLILLEDSSPAARVRAHDWLKARGRAPAGYDPLGSPKSRREAIEKALAPVGGVK